MAAVFLAALIVILGLAMIFFSIAPGLSRLADEALRTNLVMSFLWGTLAYLAFGPLVIEVNSSPGLQAIEQTSGVDIASEIISFIESRVS